MPRIREYAFKRLAHMGGLSSSDIGVAQVTTYHYLIYQVQFRRPEADSDDVEVQCEACKQSVLFRVDSITRTKNKRRAQLLTAVGGLLLTSSYIYTISNVAAANDHDSPLQTSAALALAFALAAAAGVFAFVTGVWFGIIQDGVRLKSAPWGHKLLR